MTIFYSYVFKVETRLENPTRHYMLQSQKRQVRQFLSSSDIEHETNDGSSNKVLMHSVPGRTTNLLAPPPPIYPPLTASAPAENYSTHFKDQTSNLSGTLDQGNIIVFDNSYIS